MKRGRQTQKALSILLALSMLIGLVPGVSIPAMAEDQIVAFEDPDSNNEYDLATSGVADHMYFDCRETAVTLIVPESGCSAYIAPSKEAAALSDHKLTLPAGCVYWLMDVSETNASILYIVPCYSLTLSDGVTLSGSSHQFYDSNENLFAAGYYRSVDLGGEFSWEDAYITLSSDSEFALTFDGNSTPATSEWNESSNNYTLSVSPSANATISAVSAPASPEPITVGEVTFEPWTDAMAKEQYEEVYSPGDYPANIYLPLESGSYYLTGNVTLPSGGNWSIVDGAVINLYLNGFGITCSDNDAISLTSSSAEQGGTLNLYDKEDNSGFITSGGSCGVRVEPSGTFHMYGGTIKQCGNDSNGNGVVVKAYGTQSGTFHMYGGVIDSCTSNGVQMMGGSFIMEGGTITGNIRGIQAESGTIKLSGGSIVENFYGVMDSMSSILLSGSPVIKENLEGNLVLLTFPAQPGGLTPINFDGALTEEASIGVSLLEIVPKSDETISTTGVFTSGASGKAAASNFFSDNAPNFAIKANDDGELAVYDPNALIVNGIEFTKWEKTDSLPSEPGNYYLTGNVTLEETWEVPEGTVNLCLNGKSIISDKDTAIAIAGTENPAILNLYDTEENAGGITAREGSENAVVGVVMGIGDNDYTVENEFNMYGGKITGFKQYGVIAMGNDFRMEGGEISGCQTGVLAGVSNFTMTGGSIKGGTYGVYFQGSTFNMSGGEISGNENGVIGTGSVMLKGLVSINGNTAGNLVIPVTDDSSPLAVSLSGALDPASRIGVSCMKGEQDETLRPVPFKFLSTLGGNATADNFFSDDEDFVIKSDGDGLKFDEADPYILTVRNEPVTFRPWTDKKAKAQYPDNEDATAANTLPKEPGNYYLTGDVELTSPWSAPAGEVNLSLNGKTVSNGGDVYMPLIIVNRTAKLYIHDSETGGGVLSNPRGDVVLVEGGMLYLYGGTIKDSKKDDHYEYSGHGVNILDGEFNMFGGSITGNEVAGVSTGNGEFTMAGGSITGNDVGVETSDAHMMVAESPVVKNNTRYNVRMNSNGPQTGILILGKLNDDAEIGFSRGNLRHEMSGAEYYFIIDGIVTTGLSGGGNEGVSNFFSDATGFKVLKKEITQGDVTGFEAAIEQQYYEVNLETNKVGGENQYTEPENDIPAALILSNGDTVTVTVKLAYDDCLTKPQGAEFTLSYDNRFFELVAPTETAPNPVLPDGVSNYVSDPHDSDNGHYSVTLVDSSAKEYESDTALAVFTFRVIKGVSDENGVSTSFSFNGYPMIGTDITKKNDVQANSNYARIKLMPIPRDVKLPAATGGVVLTTDPEGNNPLGADNEDAAFDGADLKLYIKDFDHSNYEYTVKYKAKDDSGETVEKEAVINPENGFAFIPAEDVTGDIEITEVSRSLAGFQTPVVKPNYINGFTLVLVEVAEENESRPVYQYGGKDMYYINRAGTSAFAYLVAGEVTPEQAAAQLTLKTTLDQYYDALGDLYLDLQEPDNNDVNGTGAVDYNDLLLDYRCVHEVYEIEKYMAIYLRADVNGDGKVDMNDVSAISAFRAHPAD
ncbi:MAG: hypothetical protein IKN81_06740 [Oscillospiraceae bacterium]|nr:hypothetical protein [Oscillospiraceae bacterium]